MNRLHLLVISLTLVLFACRKNVPGERADTYLERVKTQLEARLSQKDWEAIDFSRGLCGPEDSAGRMLLRLAFKGRELSRSFVLLQTTGKGKVLNGRIIELVKDEGVGPTRYNGAITIRALEGTVLLKSAIVNGYITSWHEQSSAQRTASLMPDDGTLPEVVVVASYSSGGISYSDWACLNYFLDNSGGSGGYYYSLDGSGGFGGGGSSGGSDSGSTDNSDGGVMSDSPILIDYENQDQLPAIEIEKFVKCFDAIPDAGATCSIEIFADVPVDAGPNKLFDFKNGSPGHTFIQIKKSNGTQSAIQNIGFYAKSGLKAVLTNVPIDGKFLDNGGHEYNASFKMNLKPDNFRSTLT